jgi:hypothetical protein
MQAEVRSGRINYVSVEHTGNEELDREMGMMVTRDLEFSGLALVPQGACEVCTIAARTTEELRQREASRDVEAREMADNTSEQIAALQKQMADMMALMRAQQEQAAQTAKLQAEAAAKAMLEAEQRAAQAAKDEAARLSQSLSAAQAEIDRLKKPVPPATTVSPAAEPRAEQEYSGPRVRWNRMKGTIEMQE